MIISAHGRFYRLTREQMEVYSLLLTHKNQWVRLTEIDKLNIMQYGRVIKELRAIGKGEPGEAVEFEIKNKIFGIDPITKKKHTGFMLVMEEKPVQLTLGFAQAMQPAHHPDDFAGRRI